MASSAAPASRQARIIASRSAASTVGVRLFAAEEAQDVALRHAGAVQLHGRHPNALLPDLESARVRRAGILAGQIGERRPDRREQHDRAVVKMRDDQRQRLRLGAAVEGICDGEHVALDEVEREVVEQPLYAAAHGEQVARFGLMLGSERQIAGEQGRRARLLLGDAGRAGRAPQPFAHLRRDRGKPAVEDLGADHGAALSVRSSRRTSMTQFRNASISASWPG